jgi:hypothetical protein
LRYIGIVAYKGVFIYNYLSCHGVSIYIYIAATCFGPRWPSSGGILGQNM